MKQLIAFVVIAMNFVSCDSQNKNTAVVFMPEKVISLKDGDSINIDGLLIKQLSSIRGTPVDGGHFLMVDILVVSGSEKKQLSFMQGNRKTVVTVGKFLDYTIELLEGDYALAEQKFKITKHK